MAQLRATLHKNLPKSNIIVQGQRHNVRQQVCPEAQGSQAMQANSSFALRPRQILPAPSVECHKGILPQSRLIFLAEEQNCLFFSTAWHILGRIIGKRIATRFQP